MDYNTYTSFELSTFLVVVVVLYLLFTDSGEAFNVGWFLEETRLRIGLYISLSVLRAGWVDAVSKGHIFDWRSKDSKNQYQKSAVFPYTLQGVTEHHLLSASSYTRWLQFMGWCINIRSPEFVSYAYLSVVDHGYCVLGQTPDEEGSYMYKDRPAYMYIGFSMLLSTSQCYVLRAACCVLRQSSNVAVFNTARAQPER
ncbi:hypothetical protein DFH29DRAFT_879612 [Suillus ampliporus]|nr:hypothetical protein DFH29DRAFT_879612 [Suillus ampliporus]